MPGKSEKEAIKKLRVSQLLGEEKYRDDFIQFLTKNHAEENAHFWLAVERYKVFCKNKTLEDFVEMRNEAIRILEDFMIDGKGKKGIITIQNLMFTKQICDKLNYVPNVIESEEDKFYSIDPMEFRLDLTYNPGSKLTVDEESPPIDKLHMIKTIFDDAQIDVRNTLDKDKLLQYQNILIIKNAQANFSSDPWQFNGFNSLLQLSKQIQYSSLVAQLALADLRELIEMCIQSDAEKEKISSLLKVYNEEFITQPVYKQKDYPLPRKKDRERYRDPKKRRNLHARFRNSEWWVEEFFSKPALRCSVDENLKIVPVSRSLKWRQRRFLGLATWALPSVGWISAELVNGYQVLRGLVAEYTRELLETFKDFRDDMRTHAATEEELFYVIQDVKIPGIQRMLRAVPEEALIEFVTLDSVLHSTTREIEALNNFLAGNLVSNSEFERINQQILQLHIEKKRHFEILLEKEEIYRAEVNEVFAQVGVLELAKIETIMKASERKKSALLNFLRGVRSYFSRMLVHIEFRTADMDFYMRTYVRNRFKEYRDPLGGVDNFCMKQFAYVYDMMRTFTNFLQEYTAEIPLLCEDLVDFVQMRLSSQFKGFKKMKLLYINHFLNKEFTMSEEASLYVTNELTEEKKKQLTTCGFLIFKVICNTELLQKFEEFKSNPKFIDELYQRHKNLVDLNTQVKDLTKFKNIFKRFQVRRNEYLEHCKKYHLEPVRDTAIEYVNLFETTMERSKFGEDNDKRLQAYAKLMEGFEKKYKDLFAHHRELMTYKIEVGNVITGSFEVWNELKPYLAKQLQAVEQLFHTVSSQNLVVDPTNIASNIFKNYIQRPDQFKMDETYQICEKYNLA